MKYFFSSKDQSSVSIKKSVDSLGLCSASSIYIIYCRDLTRTLGAYLSEMIFRAGSYLRGLVKGTAYLNLHIWRSSIWWQKTKEYKMFCKRSC